MLWHVFFRQVEQAQERDIWRRKKVRKKERNGHEWSKWVSEEDEKGQKKAQSDLLHRMCCFEMYFSTRHRESHFFNFFASAQDVNVMNMLMLIAWKGSTLLKTHPSCSTVAKILCTHSFHVMYVQLVTWENSFFDANYKKGFCFNKTNNCERQKSVLGAKTINRCVSESHSYIKLYVSSIKLIENLWVFSS